MLVLAPKTQAACMLMMCSTIINARTVQVLLRSARLACGIIASMRMFMLDEAFFHLQDYGL